MNTEWHKTTKHLVAVGMVVFGIYLLYLSRHILNILVVAALVAFLLMPVVIFLQQRLRMPRVIAILFSYLVLIITILLSPLILLPPVIDGFEVIVGVDYQTLVQNLLQGIYGTLQTISLVETHFLGFTLDFSRLVEPALVVFQDASLNSMMALPSTETILTSIQSALTLTFDVATNLAGSVLTSLLAVLLTILYSVYFSMDAQQLGPRFLRVVPEAYRPEIATLMRRLSATWRAYFRGQLILMVTIGTVTFIGNAALGLPGAFSLAVVAGLLEMIPNLGPLLAAVPAVSVALLQGSTYLDVNHFILVLMVIGFYILVQQVENNFIVPHILGEAVELHPLVIMGGVVVGTSAAGIVGALLAAPVIASGKEIMSYLYAKIQSQEPFPPPDVKTQVKQRSWWDQIQTQYSRWRENITGNDQLG